MLTMYEVTLNSDLMIDGELKESGTTLFVNESVYYRILQQRVGKSTNKTQKKSQFEE